jgi:hypothetical protein
MLPTNKKLWLTPLSHILRSFAKKAKRARRYESSSGARDKLILCHQLALISSVSERESKWTNLPIKAM